MGLKENILMNVLNARGFKTTRKIVVFESDDWGSIRMPSIRAYENLLHKGIKVDQSLYDRLDTLEHKADLSNLLEVLAGVRDMHGRPALFTLNTVLANPDFEKIKEDNYQRYHYELFFDSYQRYYGEDLMPLWKDGILSGLIRPQFHAREHINTSLWMKDLSAGHPETRIAFEAGFFGLKTVTSSACQKHYLAAYWSENPMDMLQKSLIIKDGLDLFKSTFGYNSSSLIACNYIWPVEMEVEFERYGIRYLQGQRAQMAPQMVNGACRSLYRRTGQDNPHGQYYLVRNCLFEPYSDRQKDWVSSCLQEISNSFFWNTPAILSTHRINYVSNLNIENRDNNLNLLKELLFEILKRWPEVEFMSSDSLGDLIYGK